MSKKVSFFVKQFSKLNQDQLKETRDFFLTRSLDNTQQLQAIDYLLVA